MASLYEGINGGLRLEGALPVSFSCPIFFEKRLEFMFTCELSDFEKACLYEALVVLAVAMANEGILEEKSFANVLFIPGDTFMISSTDFRLCGSHIHMCIYFVNQWRRIPGLTKLGLTAIILEELCHCIFGISDEVLVKDKVTEIYRLMHPDTTMYDLFHSILTPADARILFTSETP